MKKSIVLSCLVFYSLVSFQSRAQVIIGGPPQLTSVDAMRLKRVDTLINEYLQKGWVTGVVTIIIKDNHLVQYKGYGYADAATKKPMANDAIFRIMSQTKGITSVAAMMLYEQGKFYLDEPIADFIPAFKNTAVINTYNAADTTYTTVPAKRLITFRDLLTHSSGIDYTGIGSEKMRAIYAKAGIPSGLGSFDADLKERMNALAALPLGFQPGEKWQYGLNTDLLGCLVEIISGMSLEEFFTQKIFQPLGMKDTYFTVPAAKSNRMPTVYTEDAQHNIITWSKTFRNIDPAYPLMPKHYFSGGAGLSSTAYDYAVFLQMLLNKGKYKGVQILSPRTIEIMLSPQLDFLINDRNTFGLGFELTSKKASNKYSRNEGSFGWGGYYGTTYWADPKANLVCLFMTQHTPNSHGDLEGKFEQLVYQALR